MNHPAQSGREQSVGGLSVDGAPSAQSWRVVDKAHPAAAALADRHYSRQSVGHPQFMPPGRTLVLLTDDHRAVWGSSWPLYAQHAWRGAWVCTIFRNEGRQLSSGLVIDAVAATVAKWGSPPQNGMVTFVDAAKVKPKRDPGHCFRIAGFEPVGETKSGLLVLQLVPGAMPAARAANGTQGHLRWEESA